MATTTTIGKKKLVYKQDADGIFRLKREDANAETSESDKEIDNYLNELSDCSYKVHEEPDPREPPAASKSEKSAAGEKDKVRDTKLPNRDLSKHQQEHPKKSNPAISSYNILDFFDSSTQKMSGFHLPSFAIGIIIALASQSFQPLILHYAFIMINVMKAGVLWGLIIGGILWYAGVLKTGDINKFLSELQLRFGNAEQTKLDGYESVIDEHEYPITEDMEVPSRRHRGSGDSEKSGRSDRSASPPKERRNTLTRVVPTKLFPQREQKNKSTSDLSLNPRPVVPKLNRVLTDFKNIPRKMRQSPTKSRGFSTSSGESGSQTSMYLLDKRLPPDPLESDDLPLINEIKLMSNDEPIDYEGPSDEMSDIKRNASVMSKKSVLGTRANYSKFLANAGN